MITIQLSGLPENHTNESQMALIYVKAWDSALALGEVAEELRRLRKYGDLTTEQTSLLESIEELFWQTINERGLQEVVRG
jgi:hypothetical protein